MRSFSCLLSRCHGERQHLVFIKCVHKLPASLPNLLLSRYRSWSVVGAIFFCLFVFSFALHTTDDWLLNNYDDFFGYSDDASLQFHSPDIATGGLDFFSIATKIPVYFFLFSSFAAYIFLLTNQLNIFSHSITIDMK